MPVNEQVILRCREEYGEAFYLLDSAQFRTNFLELKSAFTSKYPRFNIAYSYKTNYIPKLCKIVNELGGYAEVVSDMEMELARRCGVHYSDIIWNGPIKDREKMKDFLLNGGTVNIDSLDEAEFIRELSLSADKQLNVGIRCNYDVGDEVISRFGFDADSQEFQRVIDIIHECNNLHLVNFQCHFAKRQLVYWPERVRGMINILRKTGLTPDRIDIGGGLFGKMEDSLKAQFSSEIPCYEDYANTVTDILSEYLQGRDYVPELVIEPGSALVGDCMKFIGTVKSIKSIRGKYFATVLGSQKNISMSGVNPPLHIIHVNEGKTYDNMDLVGFTCIEGDVLYKNYSGKIAVGDIVVLGNCGSYSLVMKPPFILPNFPVLDVEGEKIELIKRKETIDDIFNTYIFQDIRLEQK